MSPKKYAQRRRMAKSTHIYNIKGKSQFQNTSSYIFKLCEIVKRKCVTKVELYFISLENGATIVFLPFPADFSKM